jgi:CelD/BcsL family acetyltransferase involved in cellulose biosynthesis
VFHQPLTCDADIRPQAPATSCAVDVVRDDDGFRRLAADWDALVQRAGLTHPFLTYDWIRAWWTCFGGASRLHLLVVRDGWRLLGIAPLVSESAWMYGMPVRRLRLMHNDHTPRADVIVGERADEVYGAIWRTLRLSAAEWDLVQLGQVAAESPTLSAFANLAAADGHPVGVWHGESSPYLAVGGDWDAFAAGLSGRFRRNVRNRLTRLQRLGHLALEIAEDPAVLSEARADAIRLEASGWKARAGTAIASSPAAHRFYTSLTQSPHGLGLRQLFLTVSGRRIAVAWVTTWRGRMVLLKSGYDPVFAACAPVKALIALTLREYWRTGLEEFDFGGQAEPWKLEWTQTTRRHEWLFVFSRGGRARLLHPLKFQLVPALKRHYQ